jgi:nickel-dependent lactate racemase
MKIELKYGRHGLDLELDQPVTVFRTREMPSMEDPAVCLIEYLDNPIGCAPLREMARGRRDACIVVSDITRPVPNKMLVPATLETLEDAGIPSDNITFLIATGIHRAPTEEELAEIVDEEIIAAYRVLSHNARDESSIKSIGHTSSGTPIEINRTYLESDLKIVVGLVEPHFMAGYSGGRKSVAVGLTSVESIKHLHGTRFLEHPGARNCELVRNPLHAELTEIAEVAGIDFCVNAVIDARRNIGGIFCGEAVQSHRSACEFAERYCAVRADGPFDIVITTAAGYPLDTTYYQAIKGLVGALEILTPGGGIILASECGDGLGSAEFRHMLEHLGECDDYEDFVRHISEPANFVIDQWEVEMLVKALRKGEIYLYSTGLSDSDWPLTFAHRVESVEHGMSLATARHGGTPRIAAIPEGPYVMPMSGTAT